MYSQNNEEDIILKYFGAFEGFFLDIGANDGITFSNTYALAKNWIGYLVEPSPKAFLELRRTYGHSPTHDLYNVAIADYDGEIQFHESGSILNTGDTSLVSTIKRSELKRWESIRTKFEEITVPCLTFASFIETAHINRVDFLSLDIEGGELDVLPQIDFKSLKTKMICVENNGKDQYKYDAIILPYGFKLIHQNAENLIYAI